VSFLSFEQNISERNIAPTTSNLKLEIERINSASFFSIYYFITYHYDRSFLKLKKFLLFIYYFMNLTFQTTEDDVNTRLDHYLNRSTGEEISRTSIQKWIKLGYIVQSPNNQTVKSGQKVKLGEIFTIHIPPRTNTHLQPISMDIPILLEEEDFIIIQKPAGLSSHGGPQDNRPSLVNGLLYHFKELSGFGGESRPGIVHRLDKPTSGVMVIAKNDRAHIALSKKFQNREVEKKYFAWLIQSPKNLNGRIESKIGRHPTERLKMCIRDTGRKAITIYKIIKTIQSRKGRVFSLVEVMIETGRTHQIRVHFQSLGCPVVGDMLYSRSGAEFEKYGLLLFSQMIRFEHPFEKREIKVELPFPDNFLNFENEASLK
jgi:23S rRNA pseudouridine1911/1915/1917 synthase